MHKKTISIVAGALISISPAIISIAHAAQPAAVKAAAAQPIEGVSLVEATGKIESVNRETREVSVLDKNGGRTTFAVGADAKNFSQINVGDEVRVRLTRSVIVTLSKGDVRSATETETVASAPAGAKPSGEIARHLTVVADIVKVDHKSGLVSLKGPQGNLLDVQVHDRARLAHVKAGQQVTIAYTEAVSVAVTPVQ